jgi:hypothetical protein
MVLKTMKKYNRKLHRKLHDPYITILWVIKTGRECDTYVKKKYIRGFEGERNETTSNAWKQDYTVL